jgi:hypothetical protein
MSQPNLRGKSRAFNYFNVQPTFTQDPRPYSTEFGGVYSKEEWLDSRKGKNDFYDSPTLYKLRELHWKKFDGTKAIYDLARIYNFSSMKSIGEIGGIPFVQAWALMEWYPETDFVLTDADGHNLLKLEDFLKVHQVNFRDSAKPKAGTLRIEKFDLQFDSLEVFANCDLLMLWGVDYALADSALDKLFEFCRTKNISLMISSMTPMGSFRRLIYWVQTNRKDRKFFRKSRQMSLVGYYRTRKYFEALAIGHNISCYELMNNGKYSIYVFNERRA